MGSLFSFSGRSGRGHWWAVSIAIFVANILLYLMLLPMQVYEMHLNLGVDTELYSTLRIPFQDAPSMNEFIWDYGSVVYLCALLLLVPISLAVSVRRWHDLGKSGWWVLVSIIPILGALYQFAMHGFVPGESGANAYGPAPTSPDLMETRRAAEIERKTVVAGESGANEYDATPTMPNSWETRRAAEIERKTVV